MTRMHYICVVMIVVSSLLFLATYFHHIDKKPKDLSFARAVVTVTDSVIPDISNSEMSMPTLKPDLGAITEAKAVIISIIVCVGLLFFVVILVYRERKLKGEKDFQVPLIALSLMLSSTYLSMSLKSGIF